MKYSREMEVASMTTKKRAAAEDSISEEAEESGSDFAASSKARQIKRQRRTKASSTTIADPSDSKPAEVFAKGNKGKAWQSQEANLVGSKNWIKEVFARDEVWAEIKKLPKSMLNARLNVNIAADLNSTTSEKPKSQSRSAPSLANVSLGQVVKRKAAKAPKLSLNLSEPEEEPDLVVGEDIGEEKADQEPVPVPDDIRRSQQWISDLFAARRIPTQQRGVDVEEQCGKAPPAATDAGVNAQELEVGALGSAQKDTSEEKVPQDNNENMVGCDDRDESDGSTATQEPARRASVVTEEEEARGEKKAKSNERVMAIDGNYESVGGSSGKNGEPLKTPKEGPWEPTRF